MEPECDVSVRPPGHLALRNPRWIRVGDNRSRIPVDLHLGPLCQHRKTRHEAHLRLTPVPLTNFGILWMRWLDVWVSADGCRVRPIRFETRSMLGRKTQSEIRKER